MRAEKLKFISTVKNWEYFVLTLGRVSLIQIILIVFMVYSNDEIRAQLGL